MSAFHSTELFRPYLVSGERILWAGAPKQGFVVRPTDAYLIPFSILWCGFVVFWNASVWSGGTPPLDFSIFGLVFLLIGLYFLVGRFVHDAAIRRQTSYGLTDQRALVLRGTRSPKLTSLDLHHLPKLELDERADGTGTISFDSGPSLFNQGRAAGFDIWVPSLVASYQFFRIDSPRQVYELIRNQLRS